MAATGTSIPPEEKLRTTSDPDGAYVHGVLVERFAGKYDHSTWGTILIL